MSVREEIREPGSQAVYVIENEHAIVEVFLYGAHVTRYALKHSQSSSASSESSQSELDEVLFMSSKAILDGTKPIRGGIPLCFPQFGPGVLPQHGFARNQPWTLVSTSSNGLTMRLTDNESTRASAWPHAFIADMTLELSSDGSRLTQSLTVQNPGPTPIEFTTCLHSYLSIKDHVHNVQVAGFGSLQFRDKTRGGNEYTEDAQSHQKIGAETDKAYINAPSEASVVDLNGSRVLRVSKTGLADCVLWNPGPERAATIGDLSSWEHFVCVEPAAVVTPVRIEGGGNWTGSQTISVSYAAQKSRM